MWENLKKANGGEYLVCIKGKYVWTKMNWIVDYFKENPRSIAYIIFILSFSLYFSQISEAGSEGDSASYAMTIKEIDLDNYPTHFGYFVIGIIFTHILPFSIMKNLNIMSGLFGALTVSITYLLTIKLTKNTTCGLIASLNMMIAGLYWTYSMYTEIYIMQVAFISLVYLLWISKREYLSGLCFLIAMLISPLSILAIPGMAMDGVEKKRIFNRLAKFSSFSLPSYCIFHLYYWGRFFEGRSQISGTYSYGIPRNLFYYIGSFSFTSFFLLFAVISILTFRDKYRWVFISYICTLISHIIVVGMGGAFFFIPMFPITAIMMGIGYKYILAFPTFNAKIKKKLITFASSIILLFLLFSSICLLSSRFQNKASQFLGNYDSTFFPLIPVSFLLGGFLYITIHHKFKDDVKKKWTNTCNIIALIILLLTTIFSVSIFVSPEVNDNNNLRNLCFELDNYRSDNSSIISKFAYGKLYMYYTGNDYYDISYLNNHILNNTIDQFEQVWLLGEKSLESLKSNGIDLTFFNFTETTLDHGMIWLITRV